MNLPKISIIIANYNNGRFFKSCYESLTKQTEVYWEALVIDDASTDNSVEVIKDQIKNDVRFKFFQNDINIGYQRTLSKGIELSKAPIFARVDPDDALTPEAIEKSIKAHDANPEVGLVYSNFIYCDENLNERGLHKGQQIESLNEKYYNFHGEISHFASFKKEFYNKTTGIDAFIKRAEDKDIYMKMCEIAPVKYIDEDLYLYRIHDGGISTNSNKEKALFWHWVALIKMAERRNFNIENILGSTLTKSQREKNLEDEIGRYNKSIIFRVMRRIGLFKI